MKFCIFVIVLSLICTLKAQTVIKFGAFFDKDDVEAQSVFEIAISRQNVFNMQFRLEPIIKTIASMDGIQAEQAVCEMVESGAVAIVGPKSIYISDVVASICNELNIPHLVSYHRTPEINKNPYHKFTRNIFPDTTLLSKALVDVIRNYDWKKFAIIYDSDESLIRLDGVLQMFQAGHKAVTVYKYPGKEKVKHVLKEISKSLENRIIVDCTIENITEIVKQGLDVQMMTEYMTYFITLPDGHMLNIPELRKVRSNITAIRMMADEDVEAKNIVNEWRKNKKYLNVEQNRYAQDNISPNRLKIETALIRDVVTVISSALKGYKLYERISEPPTRCSDIDAGNQRWEDGVELLQNIDDASAFGITGPIRFDRNYKTREDFYMDIIELERHEHIFKKVAQWNARNGLIVTRSFEELLSQKAATIRSKVFTVITRTGMPYLELVENGTDLVGNERYEGFVKDLMDNIARVKNFTYKLVLVPGNHHGNHDPVTGKWNGMIGEILEGNADLAICDFTITYERKTVIDFSIPFMTLGISILYAKPRKEPPALLNFLKPLDTTVWLYMSTAFLCVSIALYVLAKITEADWENPHPCDDEPEELENIWNIPNCLWLAAGSIMQQGCDILPKGFPTRLTAATWWFFALIVISSYTANLAAFLTKEQMEESIQNVEDLAKESKIKYGLLSGGSTETFFKESNKSIYQKMWATMEHIEPSVFVDSNEEGIQRVKQNNRGYAFFMESATIDYITQKECNLTRVGDWLDSKAYGIGMPMNSPFRDDINQAILMLKEDRTVQHLKEKWWITKNVPIIDGVPTNCTVEKEKSDELDIPHILGAFIVLLAGIGLALLIGISEFLWNVRKVSISQKITPYEALQSEFLFACKVWITRRPVLESRESQSSSSSSNSSSEKS